MVHDVGYGVRGLQGRYKPLRPAHRLYGLEDFFVEGVARLDAAYLAQVRYLWASGGVVEAGGPGLGGHYLAVLVLKDLHDGAVDHPWAAQLEGRGAVPRAQAFPAPLDEVEPHVPFIEEGPEGVVMAETEKEGIFLDLEPEGDLDDEVQEVEEGMVEGVVEGPIKEEMPGAVEGLALSEERLEAVVSKVVQDVVERVTRETVAEVAEKVISEAIEALKRSLEASVD